jgi:hypothetical protein
LEKVRKNFEPLTEIAEELPYVINVYIMTSLWLGHAPSFIHSGSDLTVYESTK